MLIDIAADIIAGVPIPGNGDGVGSGCVAATAADSVSNGGPTGACTNADPCINGATATPAVVGTAFAGTLGGTGKGCIAVNAAASVGIIEGRCGAAPGPLDGDDKGCITACTWVSVSITNGKSGAAAGVC